MARYRPVERLPISSQGTKRNAAEGRGPKCLCLPQPELTGVRIETG